MKDPEAYLRHILDAIGLITQWTEKVTKKQFLADPLLQSAVVRQLEIIGEAATKLPAEFKATHKEIPWPEIAGMRHKLIHEYFGVDLELVWQVIERDLPDLRGKLQPLVK